MTDHRTYPCQLCGDRYPPAYLFHLKDEVPGGAKVTCLKCWGMLEEREGCAKTAEEEKERAKTKSRDPKVLEEGWEIRAATAGTLATLIRARGDRRQDGGQRADNNKFDCWPPP